MAKFFASIGSPGNIINIFDGATGDLVSSKTLPNNVAGSSYVDMSFDGHIVAVTANAQGYVWFWNQATGQTSQVSFSGSTGAGHGFDGNGVFYLGSYQQYFVFAPPYTSVVAVGTGSVSLTLYPGQIPEKSIALRRVSATGATSYVRMDLSSGLIGTQIGNVSEQGPALADTQGAFALTWMDSNYGVRFWDYETGVPSGQIGPVSGAQASSFRSGIGFTSDGVGFVIKTSDNTVGVGVIGTGLSRQVSLDPVLPYSADNAYAFVEGLLDDDVVLLSSAAANRMLLALNLTTGQVVWQNTKGYGQWQGFGDARSCGVQPTLGPGGNPPAPTGFWKELLLAYETA